MFGWLAARSFLPCHPAQRAVSRRVKRITPRALIDALAALGDVLYLCPASSTVMPAALPPGLLTTEPDFVPLLAAQWLAVVGTVTDDGPREWCECLDRAGRIVARWHLLPDSDYLGWEALVAGATDECSLGGTSWLRADRARVVTFRRRKLAGLLLLEQGVTSALSPLGQRIARHIAQAESAALHP
jgi:hypothetical protein